MRRTLEFRSNHGVRSDKGINGVLSDPTLAKIAEKRGKSVAQVILRWHVQRGNAVIPRSTNPAHIAENIDIFDFSLDDVEMKTIDALNRNERTNPKNDPDDFPW